MPAAAPLSFAMMPSGWNNVKNVKYFTFFTLFHPDGIIAKESGAAAGILVLLAGAVVFYTLGIMIFDKKDLHI